MDISVEQQGSTCLVHVSGRITMQTAHQLHQSIKDTLKNGVSRVIVDLDQVSYMDSSGVGVLVSGTKLAREKGISFGLASVAERVMLVMKMTGLEVIFNIFSDVSQAMAELN